MSINEGPIKCLQFIKRVMCEKPTLFYYPFYNSNNTATAGILFQPRGERRISCLRPNIFVKLLQKYFYLFTNVSQYFVPSRVIFNTINFNKDVWFSDLVLVNHFLLKVEQTITAAEIFLMLCCEIFLSGTLKYFCVNKVSCWLTINNQFVMKLLGAK